MIASVSPHPVGAAAPRASASAACASAACDLVRLSTCEPGSNIPEALATAGAGIRDWDSVIALAVRHRVAAYLQAANRRAEGARGAPILPPDAEQALRACVMRQALSVSALQGALTRSLAVLRDAGVPVIVLKGPVLARTLYPSPTLRPYSDIDLTVPEASVAAAGDVLRAAGFQELLYEAEAAREAHAGHVHEGASFHFKFVEPRSGGLVELHGDPLQLGLRPADEAGRWRRAVPVPGLDRALMLSWEDQVIQLSVHAHKHGFERLIWLKDLDLLLRTFGDSLNWGLVETVARAEGITASVWYALELASRLLGAPLPAEVRRRFRPTLPLRAAYRLTWPVARIADLDGSMRRRAVQFHAAESWRGMLPSLLYMGRRGVRSRAIVQAITGGRLGAAAHPSPR
jgi:hypothetical protein